MSDNISLPVALTKKELIKYDRKWVAATKCLIPDIICSGNEWSLVFQRAKEIFSIPKEICLVSYPFVVFYVDYQMLLKARKNY